MLQLGLGSTAPFATLHFEQQDFVLKSMLGFLGCFIEYNGVW